MFDDIIHHSHTLRGAGIFTNFTGCRKSLIEVRLCQNLDSLDFVVICGDFIDIFWFCSFIGILQDLIVILWDCYGD